MKLSTRCRYGTRAMIEIARSYARGPVKRKDIALSQKISAHYLENILIALKSRNLIRTIRGAGGGFALERSPDRISMYEIVTALEGSIAPVACVDTPDYCNRTDTCTARLFWLELHDAQKKVLMAASLQSLLDREGAFPASEYCI